MLNFEAFRQLMTEYHQRVGLPERSQETHREDYAEYLREEDRKRDY
jgi:hypothetical protein